MADQARVLDAIKAALGAPGEVEIDIGVISVTSPHEALVERCCVACMDPANSDDDGIRAVIAEVLQTLSLVTHEMAEATAALSGPMASRTLAPDFRLGSEPLGVVDPDPQRGGLRQLALGLHQIAARMMTITAAQIRNITRSPRCRSRPRQARPAQP
jgi:hypothetical protein